MIGSAIKTHREMIGLTLRDVADPCGISVSYLSDIEHGRTEPSLHVMRQISEHTGVNLAEYLQADFQQITEHEWMLIKAWRSGDIRRVLRIVAEKWPD